MVVHNWVAFALIANFFLWLLFYLFSDKNKAYQPEFNIVKLFNDSFRQAMYYGYGIFRGEPNPHRVDPYYKFNPLQRMLYQILMLFLLPLQFATGLLMWDVKRFSGVIDMVGGLRVVDTVHVLIFIFFVFYMCFHPYLATLGHTPTAHIKAMITGYEDVDEEHAEAAAPAVRLSRNRPDASGSRCHTLPASWKQPAGTFISRRSFMKSCSKTILAALCGSLAAGPIAARVQPGVRRR